MAGDTMTRKEWTLKQLREQGNLLNQDIDNMTEREKDIWNLKWMKTEIGYQSKLYRSGCFSSLQRIIDLMERDKSE